MSARMQMLKDRADSAAAQAREVAQRAARANRNMTADEQKTYDEGMATLEECLAGIKREKSDAATMDFIRTEFGTAPGGKGNGRRLSFKGMAAGLGTRMLTGEMGTKALAPSGAAVVAQGFTEDPTALGRAATGLLDVLPVEVQASPEYAFLRQSTRTNNAAVVEDGDTKPTSVIGLERIEQSSAIIAHLSESLPRYWLVGNGALETFIETELDYGLRVAVEAKVIADVNGTSGIQTQAFSTSIAQTLRKSLTKIEVAGYTAGAIVLHPADFEAVELAVSTTNAIEHVGLPYDAAARRLYGVPIATTVSQAVGTGHVIAAGAVVLDTDSLGVQVQWSENSNADDFAKNLIRARVEGRYGTSVLSPLGVVKATLAASGGASGASGASGS